MRILIVDDNNDKVEKIVRSLLGQSAIMRENIDVAFTIFDAKVLLRDYQYDLLVLDILLPLRAGDPPRSENTSALLTELRDRSTLRKPRHIIGLTAYEHGLRELEPIFQAQAWAIVKYESDTSSWSDQIARSVDWIVSVAQQPEREQYDVDVCVLTALDTPEYEAVLRMGWNWQAAEPVDDTTFARKGTFESRGTQFTAVTAHSPRMGMVTAALLASKMINARRPKFIVMCGICAGVKGRANYGDPVLADPCWDWQSGKHVVKDGEAEFEIAPDPIATPEWIRSRWEQLKSDNALWQEIRSAWPSAPDTELKARAGPSVSGSAVLANPEIVETIKRQHRALVSLEMEAYGVLSAARTAPCPRPTAFTCKSVSDFADEKKDDRWQSYAAYTSAMGTKAFFERYMHELAGMAG